MADPLGIPLNEETVVSLLMLDGADRPLGLTEIADASQALVDTTRARMQRLAAAGLVETDDGGWKLTDHGSDLAGVLIAARSAWTLDGYRQPVRGAELPWKSLSQLRKAAELSEHQLAQRIGMDESWVRRVDRDPSPSSDAAVLYVSGLRGMLIPLAHVSGVWVPVAPINGWLELGQIVDAVQSLGVDARLGRATDGAPYVSRVAMSLGSLREACGLTRADLATKIADADPSITEGRIGRIEHAIGPGVAAVELLLGGLSIEWWPIVIAGRKAFRLS
jgi:transcriptional regulator with XRE-family HTH domain